MTQAAVAEAELRPWGQHGPPPELDWHEALDEPEPREAAGADTTLLFIGFYLLLLAFFILLTAISSVHGSRSEQTIGSLTKRFAPDVARDTEMETSAADAGVFRARSAFQSRVKGLFETILPVGRFEVEEEGSVMRVTLPEDALFRPGKATLHDSATRLLSGIADALHHREPGIRFEMEALLGRRGASAAELAGGDALPLRRSAAIAHALRGAGAPAGNIAVGLREGPGGDLSVSFFARETDLAIAPGL